jgi:purine-binding chemotaxis protein CheW
MNMTTRSLATQYLTFKLAEESYAISIANVREVLKLPDLTRIPGVPDFIRGVINVRGSVVPVVDLKSKFGQGLTEKKRQTRIIIVESRLRDKDVVIGALADSVEEVMDLTDDQIEPPPEVGIRLKTEFIKGIGKSEDRFIILLDVGRVFSSEELIVIQGTSKTSVSSGTPREMAS